MPSRWDGTPLGRIGWTSILSQTDGPALFAAIGPRNGPPLFLIPGVCDPWHTFEPLFDDLERAFALICVDLRGHGHSGRSEVGYKVRDYLEDVIRQFNELTTEPAFVAGNSLGALLAAGIAAARPDAVRGLILEDGPFFITEPELWESKRLRKRVFGDLAERLEIRETDSLSDDQFADLYGERLFAFMPEGDLEFRLRWALKFLKVLEAPRQGLSDEARASMDAAVVKAVSGGDVSWGELFPREFIGGIARKYAHVDSRVARTTADVGFSDGFAHSEILARVVCPTLILEADRDLSGLLSAAEIEQLISLPAGSVKHRLFDGALHEIHQTHPHEMAAAILAFSSE